MAVAGGNGYPAWVLSSCLQLRSNHLYNIEFVRSRDGRDIAALLDDSMRNARAACAVVHTIFDKERH